jgi:hypothetical protein
LLTISQSLRELRPRPELVENLLPAASIVIAAGDSGSGKTTVVQYLALCVALGINFGTRRCKQRRALWIAAEDQYNARLRIEAYADHYGLDRAVLEQNFLILPEQVALMGPYSCFPVLHRLLREHWGSEPNLGLVVVDTKSAAWGGKEENSNDENAAFLSLLSRELVQPYGAAPIVLHHMTKSKENPTIRGGGATVFNADHSWLFRTRAGSRITTIEQGKKRMRPWDPFFVEIKDHVLQGPQYEHLRDPHLDKMPCVSIAELTNAFGATVRQLTKEAHTTQLLRLIRDNPQATKSQLAARMGKMRTLPSGQQTGDSSVIAHLFRQLLSDKHLAETKKAGRGGSGYALTTAGRHFLEQEDLGASVQGDESDAE